MNAEGPVLVTGATGFIGSHLCRELDARGWEVRAMRRQSSDPSALADVGVEWVVADVLDGSAVRSAADGCRTVVHLAGVGLDAAPPETVREVNVVGTRNVFEAAAETDVRSVLFASTAGTRRGDGVADESDVAPPIGAYQESKREGERLAHRFQRRGLDVVVVHPTSVFGPGDRTFTGRLLSMAKDPKLFASLPGGVSFAGVDDVVDGMVAALDRGTPGEHYLLGGENLTFTEALRVVVEEAGGYPPLVEVPAVAIRALGHVAGRCDEYLGVRFFPFDPDMAQLATSRLFYTSEKAQSAIGYRYRPFRDLVPDAVEWYRSAAR